MSLYKIVRHYADRDKPKRTIKSGLYLEEAQAHCKDPETRSKTCTSSAGRRRTRTHGPWFDGYTHDETAAQRTQRLKREAKEELARRDERAAEAAP